MEQSCHGYDLKVKCSKTSELVWADDLGNKEISSVHFNQTINNIKLLF